MLTFFIYFVTAVLVLDCLFLILLVLVQLPKKEAGMGQAFGGAATDALFGAGSGNVLTKATKWGAAIFFLLAITLTLMGNFQNKSGGGSKLQQNMNAIKSAPPADMTMTPTKTETPKTTNVLDLKIPAASTNAK
jgi:preprotein translocase subunit SecG